MVFSSLSSGISTYLKESSIHGLRYIVESRNLLFKLLWSILLLVTFGICAILLNQAWTDMTRDPILSIQDEIDVAELAPPAISILTSKQTHPDILTIKLLNQVNQFQINPLENLLF